MLFRSDACGMNPGWLTCGAVVLDGAAVLAPGIPGGAGAALKVTGAGAKVLQAVDKIHDSTKLAKNMGGGKPAYWQAHHIVPGGLGAAEGLRQKLFALNVGINNAVNGAFLRPKGVHSRLNDGRYVKWVDRMLHGATEDTIGERLKQIANTLDEWDKIIEGSTGAERNRLFAEFWEAIGN